MRAIHVASVLRKESRLSGQAKVDMKRESFVGLGAVILDSQIERGPFSEVGDVYSTREAAVTAAIEKGFRKKDVKKEYGGWIIDVSQCPMCTEKRPE
jgi:hypothetical protein